MGRTKLFKEIERWILSNPSIYVLKNGKKDIENQKINCFQIFKSLVQCGQKLCGKPLRKMAQINHLNWVS